MEKLDFNEVYQASKDNVWKLVSKYVYTKEDREDLFQEIFLSVHKSLHRFRGDSALNTWIFKIAVNTSLNHINKQKRYKLLKNVLSGFRPIENDQIVVEADIRMFAPLTKLNPQQRMVLILSDIEDKTLAEVSEITSLPVGTVKSNLSRARGIIKKEVGNNERI